MISPAQVLANSPKPLAAKSLSREIQKRIRQKIDRIDGFSPSPQPEANVFPDNDSGVWRASIDFPGMGNGHVSTPLQKKDTPANICQRLWKRIEDKFL